MKPLFHASDVTKSYKKTASSSVLAVDHVSFSINTMECFGIVGQSGSGKSTLARLITGLEPPDSGTIEYLGHTMQMVFQNPQDSFNPRRKLGKSITDVMMNFGISKAEAVRTLPALLDQVDLPLQYADRYPHQVSGGECQRAAIARAISVHPELLVFDEATSALDVSTQAQILDLIDSLRKKLHISCIFICHDIAVVQTLCDRMAVMERGTFIETGQTNQIIACPAHSYTRKLLSSAFLI